jgi:hypothetical protein
MFDLNFYNIVLGGICNLVLETKIIYGNIHQTVVKQKSISIKKHIELFNDRLADNMGLIQYFENYIIYFELQDIYIKKMNLVMYNRAFEK